MMKKSQNQKNYSRRQIKIQHVDSGKEILEPLAQELPEEISALTSQMNDFIQSTFNLRESKEMNLNQFQNSMANTSVDQVINYYSFEHSFEEDLKFGAVDVSYDSNELTNQLSPLKNDGVDLNTFIRFPKWNDDESRFNDPFENTTIKLGVFDEINTLIDDIKKKMKSISRNIETHHILTNDLFKSQKTYSIYDQSFKDDFCLLAKRYGVQKIAHDFNLSTKSLKRWIKSGTHRKVGGGRKEFDTEMEVSVYKWYLEQVSLGKIVTPKMIKEKAISLCRVNSFKASKGWLKKFKTKYHLPIYRKNNIAETT